MRPVASMKAVMGGLGDGKPLASQPTISRLLRSAWPKMPSGLWGAPAGHFRGNFQDCRSLTDLGECTQNLVSMPQSACTCVE